MSTAVRFKGISKAFPGVQALSDVSLEIAEGSCHALMGENGAGKSTLGKILAGLYRPDHGEIQLFERSVSFHGPLEASLAGVSIVHQELLFCENLTVAENLCLDNFPRRGPFVDREAMRQKAQSWLDAIHSGVSPDAVVGELSTGRQQLVQIAGAVGRGARVVIFDEPTSSLSQTESEALFAQIDRLKAEGVTCIYVSHRMEEIFRLCDVVSVLRDGHYVATKPTSEITRDDLVRLMVGRSIAAMDRSSTDPGETLLSVKNLSSPGKFSGISFEMRKGEVLGFAGLVGSGRTEVAEALFGIDPHHQGAVSLKGNPVRPERPAQMLQLGLGLAPEDRKRLGLILGMNVRENETLPVLPTLATAGLVRRAEEDQLAEQYSEKLRVKTPSIESGILGLSGGNQQQVVLAKWLAAECDVLILDEPTRGVDVGAKAEIHEMIRELASSGKAILVISSELPELLTVTDRILVLRQGKIVFESSTVEATEQSLVAAMTGN